jgi:hypothetical protein
LPLGQVEALESGEIQAFGTIDEMVAAAVLYGATLGVGRDEALALLDKSIAAVDDFDADATGEIPVLTPETIAQDAARRDPNAGLLARSLPSAPEPLAARREAPVRTNASMVGDLAPLVPPVFDPPSASVDAAAKLDTDFGDTLARKSGELDAWASQAERDTSFGATAVRTSGPLAAVRERAIGVIGEERWFDIEHGVSNAGLRLRDAVASVRQWTAERPYGTLVLALVVGAIMAGLLFSFSALLGGGEDAPTPVTPQPTATAPAATTPAKAPAKKAAPVAIRPPAKVQVDVLNAGSTKGLANELADRLEKGGYRINNVGNTDTTYSTDIVLYRQGFQREAQRVAKRVGIKTFDTIPASVSGVSDVIVVIH